MTPNGRALRDIVLYGALTVGAGAFVWHSWQADAGRGPSADSALDLARTACRTAIRAELLDPGRTEWNLRHWPAIADSEGRVRVEAQIRAPNALGALIPSRWLCEVQIDGTSRRILRLEPRG